MKKISDYLFRSAAKKSMVLVVFLMTVCESIFLFIPTEVFMTPPIIANKKNALPVVIAAALGSLVGGAISFLIGMYLYESVGAWLIETFSSPEGFEQAQALFGKHGLFIVIMAAFAPVPYKLIAMAAGFLRQDPVLFLGLCAIFRTGRFAIAGYLLWRFQEQANKIAKKYFWPLTAVAIAAALAGALILAL